MTFLDRVRSIFNRGLIAPPNPSRSLYFAQLLDADGKYFGPQEALQLSVVWACVSAIARALAGADWKVYERIGSQVSYFEDDAIDYLLNVRPNPEMNAVAVREAVLYGALTWGNGYAEIVRDQAGRLRELWPLYPGRVQVIRIDDQGTEQITGSLAYRCTNPNAGPTVILKPEQMYHLRGPSLTGLMGENMAYRAAKTLTLSAAADTFATSYYRNGTVVGTVIETTRPVSDQTFHRMKADWAEKRSGPDAAHKAVFLEPGMSLKNMGDSSAQASQMLEARKFQVEEVARWFGVPLHMIGSLAGAQGYGTNLEQLGLGFVRDCLGIWAKRMEQEADWKFFPMRGPGARKQTKLDLSPLTRGDSKTRAEAYAILRKEGVYSANDILRLEGMNPIGPEGDVRFVDVKMQTYEQVDLNTDKLEVDIETAKNPPTLPAPAGANDAGSTDTETGDSKTSEAT